MSKFIISIPLLLLFVLISLVQVPASTVKESYIVYLGSHSHSSAHEITRAHLHSVTRSHHDFLTSFLGSKQKARASIITSFKRYINGFAAYLEEQEAAQIAEHPKVLSVFLNKAKKLHTTHSWDFMSLEKDGKIHQKSLWKKAKFGENTIIANLDTGVWPESQSFSDKGYGPVPSKWKGGCAPGVGVPCNRKLIGARYFSQGFIAGQKVKLNSTYNTARDQQGHGTHTLSTVGGNFVSGVSVFGFSNGTAKGGSPKARVATYKVCWPNNEDGACYDADIMSGFDMAIHDRVDVISLSVGGSPADYFDDGISIGAFHAVKHGIPVISSAGNNGPSISSVVNVSPWLITVGASTIDREIQAFVELPNGSRFKGTSLSDKHLPEDKFYPLINGTQARKPNAALNESMLCMAGTLNPEKVRGKILACLRGNTARVDKGIQAELAGAVGMILCNAKENGNELLVDPHVLPASQLTYTDGLAVFEYINSTRDPLAIILSPSVKVGTKPAPYMATFSSRGPNLVTPQILKPDVTAPGVNILAAYSEGTSPTNEPYDTRRIPYTIISGTSMSCPHVSGIVGLLKTLHPDWSTSAIQSAIMTTARTRDNTKKSMLDSTHFDEATPFAHGSGHIQPNRAMDPGLVYDLSINDYLDFLCAIGYNQTKTKVFSDDYECPKSANLSHFNYPSISVPNITHVATVTRRLKNVGSPGTYTARVIKPRGFSVSVEPNSLRFKTIGEEKSFKVTLKLKESHRLKSGEYVFGGLNWSDGKHYVRSPIVVSWLGQHAM